jgi:hypothetical protein
MDSMFGFHQIPHSWFDKLTTNGGLNLDSPKMQKGLSFFSSNIIAQGKTPSAVELSKDIGQMLCWAEKRKPWRALLIDGNPSELVKLCQNHVIDSKVDRVYLLDDYADEKRDAWDKLGKRLEEILAAAS